MPMTNPTVGRRVAPEEGAGSLVPAPGEPVSVGEWGRKAYALPFASLISLALVILILFKLADFRFAVSGAVAAGRR